MEEPQLLQQQEEEQSQSVSLQDCLKLLKGEQDEQRLAGLLLVTKSCKSDDLVSLRAIYDAVGPHFLDRLLRTGLGKGVVSSGSGENRDAYLQLSVSVLSAFCRVSEIASSKEMVSKVPMIFEVMSMNRSGMPVLEECYEFLYLVSTASEDGLTAVYESGGIKLLAHQMSALPDGSRLMELATKLVQLMLKKLSQGIVENDHLSELSVIVTKIARQFALLQNALKFEALHLLSAIFSSEYSTLLHDALRVIQNENWSNHMRDGVATILQNRVAPAEKFEALILAESMVSIKGEGWLIGQINLPNVQDPTPADRCLLLVLESSRVEVAVLLNELAYSKYEASKSSSSTAETIISKQQKVTVVFSLVEKIIKLISNIGETEGHVLDENTFIKAINGLNETIGVVLEYLQDAKEHGQKVGNDLLASVRLVGSYLAEAPVACEDKITELLGYMLSVEGEHESSPFYSVCFLLPMLCQKTMKIEGCKLLASSGGYKACELKILVLLQVVDCLMKLIEQNRNEVENNGCIFLACDTIMNLLKMEQITFSEDESTFISLLKALALWTEKTNDQSFIMLASSICTLIFDMTSENALLNHPSFSSSCLDSLSRLIARSLASWGQDMSDAAKADMDLLEIVTAGYSRWADRFPQIQKAVGR
ncbi:neurochondrin isoform X1 [Gossypium hirsutum]|uniref:Neurochondrin isoform X1 n=1 Tax=Gossypium hirsutum TaxID=3635 RepID=A0ABM3BX30_GOSHI|nr:neurochondrin-like isoform X1 [Gossypium hirsutum]XP_040971611.1 neurochondrin-like isoform X1 [Gossypium hirsutum]